MGCIGQVIYVLYLLFLLIIEYAVDPAFSLGNIFMFYFHDKLLFSLVITWQANEKGSKLLHGAARLQCYSC